MSIFFCNTEAQLKMDCDGDVGIGYMSGDPGLKLVVKGQAYFTCEASSGIYLTNFYPNNLETPVIKPQWGNTAFLGLYTNRM